MLSCGQKKSRPRKGAAPISDEEEAYFFFFFVFFLAAFLAMLFLSFLVGARPLPNRGSVIARSG